MAGARTARRMRLMWGIRCVVVGLAMLAGALVSAVWCIARFAFGETPATWVPAVAAALFVLFWVVLPKVMLRADDAVDD